MSIDGGDPQVLWRGFVDQANPGFDAEVGDIVTLECIDAKGEAGRADIPAVDPPVGAGETIQARLNRICAGADWPTYWRHFDTYRRHRRRHRTGRSDRRPVEPGRRLRRRVDVR